MAKMMSSAQSFAPPRASFGVGGMLMALMAHGFLVAALTWGIAWHSNKGEIVTASAELWSQTPQEAAPPLDLQPPAPIKPETLPTASKEQDIVTSKAKAKEAADLLAKEKADAAKRKLEDANKLREQIRQEQIKRMAGLAGASGAANSTGTAMQNSAPSNTYAGRVKAKVKPNIVFQNAEGLDGDPTVEIAIRLAPDGTVILPLKITKSSGNTAWDNAVVRGIEKTEVFPRDGDGKFPGPFTLAWRLKE